MRIIGIWHRLRRTLWRPHGPVRSFEQDLSPTRVASRAEISARPVEVKRIVGSVGRAANLRSDFFERIGKTMEGGEIMPRSSSTRCGIPGGH